MKYSRGELSYTIAIITAIIVMAVIFSLCKGCSADIIDLDRIKQIESSNNPLAYNKTTKATGLYQITEICLLEYNNYNKTDYILSDMYNPILCHKVAEWYLNKRIPQMLRYYNKPITLENCLVAYNAGISYVVYNKPLPEETVNYIRKYKQIRR
jgi:soluble lytic murein transglycosylase-like protein